MRIPKKLITGLKKDDFIDIELKVITPNQEKSPVITEGPLIKINENLNETTEDEVEVIRANFD